jgi:hypothetical protein
MSEIKDYIERDFLHCTNPDRDRQANHDILKDQEE